MTTNETPKSYPAVIVLDKDYPELKNAEVVICDYAGEVSVGVKARYRVFGKNESGYLTMHEEQCGDYRVIGKSATVGELFDVVKELTGAVALMAADAMNPDKGEKA